MIRSRKFTVDAKSIVSPKFPEIDRVVAEWCAMCLSKGAVITGPLIRTQAKRVAEHAGITGIMFPDLES